MTAIAIIGSNGQLGWQLVRQCRQRQVVFKAMDFPQIDITDPCSISANLDAMPIAAVVNAAAYTAVDRAESDPEAAFAVNRDGAANLARYCQKRQIMLIHVSTDYVFDGLKKGAYAEEDPTAPLGVYGRSKAAGENQVRSSLKNHVIIRTAWLYGVHGDNFVKTMIKLGRQREVIRVVADQYGCPTNAADLAGAILEVVARQDSGRVICWGTYHYCGRGTASWHQFATAVFENARCYEAFKVKQILPITTAEYPTPAKRPCHSVLDCTKIGRCLDIFPRPWEQSLQTMIGELYRGER